MPSIEQITQIIQVLEGEDTPDVDALSADVELQRSRRRANVSLLTVAAILVTVPVASPWGPREGDGSSAFSTRGLPKGGYDALGSLDHPLEFNSCGVDCMATLFKLLRLGFDDRDYQGVDPEAWRATLSPITKELLDLVEQDWNAPDDILNRTKMGFYKACLKADVEAQRQGGIALEDLSPLELYRRNLELSEIFQAMVDDLKPVLGFTNVRCGYCFECKSATTQPEETLLDIGPPSNTEVSIQGLIQEWFQLRSAELVRQYCSAGHACKSYQNTVAKLPEILFLRPQGNKMEGNSTPRRCTFHYQSPEQIQAATYGWLGSICHGVGNHWKLYWRHEDPTMIWVYDHLVSSSLIAHPKHNRNLDNGVIPEDWVRGELIIIERLYQGGLSRSERVARTIPLQTPIPVQEIKEASPAIHQDDTYMYGGIGDIGTGSLSDDDVSDEAQNDEDMEDVQQRLLPGTEHIHTNEPIDVNDTMEVDEMEATGAPDGLTHEVEAGVSALSEHELLVQQTDRILERLHNVELQRQLQKRQEELERCRPS